MRKIQRTLGPMRLLVLVVAFTLLFATACGGGGENGDAGDTAGAAEQTVQVSATDFEFDPAEISTEAGDVTIELANDGQAPHALEIEGEGVEEESETIDPGESTTLAVELEEGTYEIYCPVGDHADRGMVGTLTVGGAAGAGGGATTGETETDQDDADGETKTGEDDTGGGGY